MNCLQGKLFAHVPVVWMTNDRVPLTDSNKKKCNKYKQNKTGTLITEMQHHITRLVAYTSTKLSSISPSQLINKYIQCLLSLHYSVC